MLTGVSMDEKAAHKEWFSKNGYTSKFATVLLPLQVISEPECGVTIWRPTWDSTKDI